MTHGCERTNGSAERSSASAPRSMTISGSRAEWEEWTGMTFPDDGDYVVPGALVPVHFKNERGLYVEPNVWVRHAV